MSRTLTPDQYNLLYALRAASEARGRDWHQLLPLAADFDLAECGRPAATALYRMGLVARHTIHTRALYALTEAGRLALRAHERTSAQAETPMARYQRASDALRAALAEYDAALAGLGLGRTA